MQPNVPAVCRAVKEMLGEVDGVAIAFYPKPNRIEQSVTAVVLWGARINATTIEHSAGDQQWLAYITVQLLIPAKGDTPREIAKLHNIVTLIADAFGIGDYGEVPGPLDGLCDHCLLVGVEGELAIPYGGDWCYGANLTFEAAFTRTPGLE